MTEKEKLNLIKNIIDSNLEENDKFELFKIITKDYNYYNPNGGWFNPKEEGIDLTV